MLHQDVSLFRYPVLNAEKKNQTKLPVAAEISVHVWMRKNTSAVFQKSEQNCYSSK